MTTTPFPTAITELFGTRLPIVAGGPLVSGQIGRNAYVTGDWSKGLLAAGHALAFVDKVEPLAAIVARLRPHAGAATATARGNLQ